MLNLSQNNIDNVGFRLLFQSLLKNRQLVDLNIGNSAYEFKNSIGIQNGPLALMHLLQHQNVEMLGHITALRMRNVFLGDQGMYNLSPGFKKLSVLETLDLSCNDMTHFGMEFFVYQGLLAGIERKDKEYSVFDQDEVMSVKSGGFQSIHARQIQQPVATGLRFLDVSFNPIGNKGAEHLGRFMQSKICFLKSLNASYCKIYMRGAVLLLQGIAKCKTLDFLNMDGNEFGSQSRLNSKHIRQFQNSLHEAIDDGLTASLQTVHMNHCALTDAEAQPLAEAISRHNSTLTNLSLSHNSIKHKGASLMFRAMASQTSCMVSLDLSYNQIDDQCEYDLCHLVKYAPKALERIKLSNNSFVAVARALVVALKTNSRLKVLDLSKNLTDLRCQKEIEALVRRNRELTEKHFIANLELERNKLRDKLRDHKGKTEKDLATAS